MCGLGQTRVMISEHRFMTSWLEAKHCATSSFGNFMFCSLRVCLQMMMKTPSDVCRSCLGRQLWFSANSSAEQVWKGSAWQKRKGRNALLMLGWLITAVEDGRLFVTPHYSYGRASRNPSVVQVAFLQLPVENVPCQENPASVWQKNPKPTNKKA